MQRTARVVTIIALGMSISRGIAAQTNTFTTGTPFNSPVLTGFDTDGSLMAGMMVTWSFVGGGSSSASWADLGGGKWGVSAGGFSVMFNGTQTFTQPWVVQNNSGSSVSSIRFDGAPGRTIFDCAWTGSACQNTGSTAAKGTPGSEPGTSLTSLGGSYFGSVNGFYTDMVGINGAAPVGDEFERLTIDFVSGLGDGELYAFLADTDNSDFNSPPPAAVAAAPEPGSITLLATGLAMLGVTFRRRRNRA